MRFLSLQIFPCSWQTILSERDVRLQGQNPNIRCHIGIRLQRHPYGTVVHTHTRVRNYTNHRRNDVIETKNSSRCISYGPETGKKKQNGVFYVYSCMMSIGYRKFRGKSVYLVVCLSNVFSVTGFSFEPILTISNFLEFYFVGRTQNAL